MLGLTTNAISPISATNFTPTIGGTTSNPSLGLTSQKHYYYVIGKILYVNYQFYFDGSGTAGSGTMTISLPSGFTVDTNKITTDDNASVNSFYAATKVGYGNITVSYNIIATIYTTDTTKILLYYTNYTSASGRLAPVNHNSLSFNISVPIQ
jgi:hypothetical protein